jgi:cytochrome b561
MQEPRGIAAAGGTSAAYQGVADYSRTAVFLHWLIAVLILSGFTIGANMVDLRISPEKVRLYSYHKWIGITVLGLALIRSVWRLTHAAPPDEPMPTWQRWLAHATHALLYILMLTVPLIGWIYSSADGYPVVYLGLWQLPNLVPKNPALASVLVTIHTTLAWTLFYLVLLHAAGALKHHFIDRDATLRRMLRWQAQRAGGTRRSP